MQRTLLTTADMNQRMHWLSPALVFLLLWGAMAFSVHSHQLDDEGSVGDSECQICIFASISAAPVPHTTPILTPLVSLVSVSESLTEAVYISLQLYSRQPRAPPAIS